MMIVVWWVLLLNCIEKKIVLMIWVKVILNLKLWTKIENEIWNIDLFLFYSFVDLITFILPISFIFINSHHQLLLEKTITYHPHPSNASLKHHIPKFMPHLYPFLPFRPTRFPHLRQQCYFPLVSLDTVIHLLTRTNSTKSTCASSSRPFLEPIHSNHPTSKLLSQMMAWTSRFTFPFHLCS